MPQKCRVKHMCMRLLEQAPGDKSACSRSALPTANALCAAVPSVGQDGSRVSCKVSKENPQTGGSQAVIHRVAPFPLSQS